MTAKRILLAGAALLIPGLGLAGTVGLDEMIGDLPDGKAVIICHSVTISPATTSTAVTSQGTVSGTNIANVLTDDPDTGAAGDATVTPVQVAPVITGNIIRNVSEDVPFNLTLAEFDAVFSDPNSGDTLQTLRILTLPSDGTIFPGGGGILGAGDLPADIPRAEIAGTNLIMTPNFHGSDSFTFTLSDGSAFASGARTYTINVASVNDGPLPLPDDIDRYATSSLKFPASVLLANDLDPDTGDNTGLRVRSVSPASANGGSVSLAGGIVFYDPRGHSGPDSFTYIVEDSLGLAFALPVTVNVNITDDPGLSVNINVEIDPATGDVSIQGAGIPGRTYRVQAADTGIPNWFDLPGGTVVADAQGRFTYADPGPLPPTRIYRTVHP